MKIYVGTFVATLIAKFPIVFMVTVFTSIPTVTVFTFITNLKCCYGYYASINLSS